jgi:L-ascorbate metabolism protein UlaG (beta-lactamase superfamily)
MIITFLGHSSLYIETMGSKIMVDPFISGNPLITDEIKLSDYHPDYILVTHAHNDHTLDVATLAKATNAIIVSNFEIATYYENQGFRVHPMNFGGKWSFDFGAVKYVHAFHTSSFPDGADGGAPGSFVVSSADKNIFIAGDTALSYDMKLIPLFHKIDLAILPVGDNFTMGVDEALVAADFLECSEVLGYHFDTFGYIKIDKDKAKAKFKKAGKTLTLLEIGGSITV